MSSGPIGNVNVNDVVSAAQANQGGGSQAPSHDSGSAPSPQSNASQSQSHQQAKAEAILNLDSAQKFKFAGREWTPEDLKKSTMLHSDYTKKTQALAETSKYYDNLEADLEYIRTSHNREEAMQAFMETYPKTFHRYLSLVSGSEAQARGQSSQQNLPPEIMRDLQMVKSYVQEKETQAIEAQLDNTFSALSKKYPDGDEELVLAKAQALLDAKRETNPGFRITNEIWEKLWKASHDRVSGRFEAKQKGILEKQRQSNQSFKGPSHGGGVPGQAPAKMNMKQATEYAVQTLTGKRG